MESHLESISDDMFEIGKKYAEQAKLATSLKQARIALALSRDAYNMVIKIESIISDNYQDPYYAFLASVERSVARSQLWIEFVQFCSQHEVKGISKKELFSKLPLLDFKVKKHGGTYTVFPPLDRRPLIEIAKKTKIIDASFSSVSEADDQSK